MLLLEVPLEHEGKGNKLELWSKDQCRTQGSEGIPDSEFEAS